MSNPKYIAKNLPPKDFIPLAKRIAACSKPVVLLPRSVLKKLERAIALRRHCSSWFKVRAYAGISIATSESHQYFIDVLETTSELLKPLGDRTTGIEQRKDTISSTSESRVVTDPEVKLQNRFKALAIEELEEVENLGTVSQKKKSGKSPPSERTTFVPEQQPQTDEFLLGSFCFFQDLQDVRSFLQDIWQRHKQKQVALMTASLVTNTALDFVRRTEQDFMITFAQSGDYYDCFVDQMFCQACTIQGHPFLARKDIAAKPTNLLEGLPYVDELADEAEWILLPSWHLLKYYTRLLEAGEFETGSLYGANLHEGFMKPV
jgi:hypothetical protein